MIGTRRKAMLGLGALALSGATALGAALPASAAGSWSTTDSTTTTVATSNQYYFSSSIAGPSGTSGNITRLTYSFTTSYPIPSGHYEYLCNTTVGQCVDITGSNTGAVTAWNGRPATDVFAFRYINQDRNNSRPNWRLTNKKVNVEYN